MKIKYFFLSVLACGAMVACTDDSEVGGNVTSDFKGGEAYVKVRIAVPNDTLTRATDGGYEEGTAVEQAIKHIQFAFYDNDGDFVAAGKSVDNVAVTPEEGNVEGIADAVVALELEQGAEFPTQVIAYVNMGDLASNKTIADMKAHEITGEVASTENGFMMTNSTYLDSGVEKIATAVTSADFFETVAMATAAENPVTIYVERLAAKVEVEEASSLPDNIEELTDAEGNTLTFTLEGYALNGTNNCEYALKNIDAWNWTTWTWNNATDHRSHWAKDPNYEDMTNKPLSYVSYNDVINNAKAAQYCKENTLTNDLYTTSNFKACTHVLVVGNYAVTNEDGASVADEDGTFYMYGGTAYSTTNLMNIFINNGKEIYTYENEEYKKVPVTAYELVRVEEADEESEGTATDSSNNGSEVNEEESKSNEVTLALIEPEEGITYYEKKVEVEEGEEKVSYTAISDYDAFNKELAAIVGGAEKFDEGKAYFAVPIEHFGVGADGATNVDGAIGVVRNHYYKLNIQSIKGLGDGVYDPDEEINWEWPHMGHAF